MKKILKQLRLLNWRFERSAEHFQVKTLKLGEPPNKDIKASGKFRMKILKLGKPLNRDIKASRRFEMKISRLLEAPNKDFEGFGALEEGGHCFFFVFVLALPSGSYVLHLVFFHFSWSFPLLRDLCGSLGVSRDLWGSSGFFGNLWESLGMPISYLGISRGHGVVNTSYI